MHATEPRHERILLIGPPGSGKSTSWRSIAEWLEKTDTPGRLWVADTDLAWEGQRPADGSLDKRVEATLTFDWETLRQVVEDATKNYEPGDWLVIDMINQAWTYVQNYYTEQVFGKELDRYWLEAQKTGINPGGDYGSNWVVINKLYTAFMLSLARYPGHLLACAPVVDVRQPDRAGKGGDSKEILHLFGRLGVKPEGQKALAYHFHSVLLCQEVPKEGWTYTTVKDRNRPQMVGEKMTDFVRSYLMKVAGWRA